MKRGPKNKLKVIISVMFVLTLFTVVVSAMISSGKINPSTNASVENSTDVSEKTSEKNDASSKTVKTSTSVDSEDEEEGVVAAATTVSSRYTSINDVHVDSSGNIFATDGTGNKVYKLNSNGNILSTYAASSQVNGICVANSEVYLLEGGLAGKITVLDTGNLAKKKEIEVGHTPTSMVVNGTTGYVANRFSNSVSVINLSTGTVTTTIKIDGREPDALALANNKVYVACHLPDDPTTSDVMASNIVIINTSTNRVSKTMNMINGAGGVKDICASPDGKTVYVSHIIARYAYPTTQLDRGWINTNAVSIIDTTSDTTKASVLLDEVELGAANPWGITVSTDGSKLVCALSGLDEVMIVDIAAMNNKISKVQNGSGVVASVEDIPDYLPFLNDCRKRVLLSGKGARAVYANGNNVYVGLYFDGSVDVVNLDNDTVRNLSFVSQPESDDIRMGEIIFSDATLCYQKWQSCLSCHPDARVDGYNWDNINDGLGNPKSARSMLYSHRTPPVMSTGIRANAETAVRAGMKYIQFNALEEKQMAYMDEYLKSVQPEPSPYLNRDGTLTESATRGKALFESEGCVKCHPAPLYTDLKMHPTKATQDNSNWEYREMDTPTLVEVWRTAPWVFDGRFSTMEDTVRYYTEGKNLTNSQITDLTNYVMSIGAEGEQYGAEQVIVTHSGSDLINSLTPGGKITQLTVRRQTNEAPDTAKVTLTLTNANGKQINSVTKTINNVTFNIAKLITLDTPISIPTDLAGGSALTVSITDTNGNALASDLVIEY